MAGKFVCCERILAESGKVLRQPGANRFVHWGMALSISLLFFSGFGQLPLYRRYMLADLSGLAWTANFGATLTLHYGAASLFLFVAVFHLAYHGLHGDFGLMPRRGDLRESWLIMKAMVTRGAEPASHKYLAEQRIAYAFIAGNALVIALSGLLKVWKNQPGVAIAEPVLYVATMAHNLASVLLLAGIVGHLVALIIPANRSLVPGMFHGRVNLAYVAHRHSLWHAQLAGGDTVEETEVSAGVAATAEQVTAPARVARRVVESE